MSSRPAIPTCPSSRGARISLEVSGDWTSRPAENNFAELIPPRGDPALFLWEKRWGKG
jgi:hypothetical protein